MSAQRIFSEPPTFALGDHITAKHLLFFGLWNFENRVGGLSEQFQVLLSHAA
jgi:hypothetical protein